MTPEERKQARLQRLEARKNDISFQKLSDSQRDIIRQSRSNSTSTSSTVQRKGCGCSRR